MNKRLNSLLALMLVFTLAFTCGVQSCADYQIYAATETEADVTYTPQELYAKCSKAVVEIICVDKNGTKYVGTGFFVSKTRILTSFHVITAAQSIIIHDYDNTRYTIKSIYGIDEDNNLALIQVKESNPNYLKFETEVTVGEDIYCIGSPCSLTGSFINGMVSRTDKVFEGISYTQLCMPVGTGLGGGPVINTKGKVIGLLSLTVQAAQNVAFAHKANTCKSFINLAKVGKHYTLDQLFKMNAKNVYTTNVYNISDTYSTESHKSEKYQGLKIKTAAEIYRDSWKAMVDIQCTYQDSKGKEIGSGTGSGFFINTNTIMTNRHVVKDYKEIRIIDYLGNEYEVETALINPDSEADIALLVVSSKRDTKHGWLEVDTDYIPATGDLVYALGSPLALSNTFSNGIVSMPTRTIEGFDYIAMTTPISVGSSGGPVFNEYGIVIGMTTLTVGKSENTNFALQMKYYGKMIK